MFSIAEEAPTLLSSKSNGKQVRFDTELQTPRTCVVPPVPYPEPPFDTCLLRLALRQKPALRKLINDPAVCAIRVRDLDDLLATIKPDMMAYCAAHKVDDCFQHVCQEDPCPFDHQGIPYTKCCKARGTAKELFPNMHLVVGRYVKPWTRKYNVSYAGALIAIQAARTGSDGSDMKAQAFISHNWEELFEDFVKTALAALDRDDLVWICSFLINQNADIGKALGTDLNQVPFARALRRADRVINFMDFKAATLTRSWVVFETNLALTDPRGIDFHVSLPDNSDSDAWNAVYEKLQSLDVRQCQASKQSDHDMIMQLVAGNEDTLNTRVRDVIGRACMNAGALEAARRGNMEVLAYECKHPLCHDAGFTTTLHYAAEAPNPDALKFLITRKADLERKNKDGDIALHFAARSGRAESAVILLEAGADISTRNSDGTTPLHAAAEQGHLEIAEVLVQRGGNANAVDGEGMTPLHCASHNACVDLAQALAKFGAEVNARSMSGRTPLHSAAFNGQVQMVETLIDLQATLDAQDKNGETALHCAACNGQTKVAEKLISLSATIDAKTHRDWTPLHWAAYEGHEPTATLLLELGAAVDAQTNSHRSALHLAASNGHPKVVAVLIKRGADAAAVDGSQKTALHWAATNGHADTVKKLVKWGMPLDGQDSAGRTALHMAAAKGHTETAATLVQLGAAVDVVEANGRTPFAEAQHHAQQETIDRLQELGANESNEDMTDGILLNQKTTYSMNSEMNARLFRAGRHERESTPECSVM
jgi:ankyrin repeat protein